MGKGVMVFVFCFNCVFSSCIYIPENIPQYLILENEIEKVVDLREIQDSPRLNEDLIHWGFIIPPPDDPDTIHFVSFVPSENYNPPQTIESIHYFSLDPDKEKFTVQEVYPGLGIELAGLIDAFGIYRGACWITDGQTLWTHALNEFVSYDLHEKIILKHGSIPGI